MSSHALGWEPGAQMLIVPRQLLQYWSACWMLWSVVVLGQTLPTILSFPRLAMPADLGDPLCPLLKPAGMTLRISLQPLIWMCREAECEMRVMLRFCRLVFGLLAPATYTSPGSAFPLPSTATWPHHSLPSAPVGALSKKNYFPAVESHFLIASKLATTLCCCICRP